MPELMPRTTPHARLMQARLLAWQWSNSEKALWTTAESSSEAEYVNELALLLIVFDHT